MAKTRNKTKAPDKDSIKQREKNKQRMRAARAKSTEEQLEEKRRKDRDRYQKKKDEGKVKKIAELTPRHQRTIRKGWVIASKAYRDRKKRQRMLKDHANDMVTPPSSPAPSFMDDRRSGSSRVLSGRVTSAKNRRKLKLENQLLRKRLREQDANLSKLKMRLSRSNKKVNLMTIKLNEKACNETAKSPALTKYLEIKQNVRDYLEQDECSRLTAGKKETITRNKTKKQIRLLNDNLINLHKDFQEKTKIKISYSLFCRFRPFWVIAPSVSTRNTCLCAIHANMENITKSLWTAKMIDKQSPKELIKTICCDGRLQEKCLARKCENCQNKQIHFNKYHANDTIKYERWVTKKVNTIVKGKEKMCQKTIKESVLTKKQPLAELFLQKLPGFMLHVMNIIHQHQVVTNIKTNLTEEEAFLQIDFSENYGCKYGEEVQGAHFGGSKSQITLHTSVLYHKTEEDQIVTPFCTVSESLRHDPVLICAHLDPLLKIIKEIHPSLRKMHFMSDGPSTQYRNRKMFFLLVNFIAEKLGVSEILWHFSESGHGKGAADGVGGCVKRTADRAVALGRDISGFDALVRCLTESCKGIRIIPIDDSETEYIESLLQANPTKPFKGTMSIHQLAWSQSIPDILQARRLSCLECQPNQICSHYSVGVIYVGRKAAPIPNQENISNSPTPKSVDQNVSPIPFDDTVHEDIQPVANTFTSEEGVDSSSIVGMPGPSNKKTFGTVDEDLDDKLPDDKMLLTLSANKSQKFYDIVYGSSESLNNEDNLGAERQKYTDDEQIFD